MTQEERDARKAMCVMAGTHCVGVLAINEPSQQALDIVRAGGWRRWRSGMVGDGDWEADCPHCGQRVVARGRAGGPSGWEYVFE